jgi:hypothetical protein
MKRRFKPKQWARPRSRAAREAMFPAPEPVTAESAYKIIRRLWSDKPQRIMDRPEWAKVALKFGWLTPRGFAAVPEFWTGRMTPSISEALYRESPLIGMIKKTPQLPGGDCYARSACA